VNKTETRFVNEDIRENKPNADQLGSTKNESYETAENSRSSSTSVENDINTDFRKSSKRERTNEESSRKKEQLNTATLIVIGSIIIGAAVMYFSGTYFVLLLIPLLLLVIMGIIYLVLSAKFRKAEVAEEDAEQQNKVKRKNKLVWLTIGFVAALFGFLFLTVLLFALSGIIGILGIIGFLATIVGYVFLVRKIKSNESSQAL
jgi:FtsH-binding integral membrane protein